MDFGLERSLPKRTYAGFIVYVLLSLGICLASASPEKLSADRMQGEGVYTYAGIMDVVNGIASASEINEFRARMRAIFAFQQQYADAPSGCLFSNHISDIHINDPAAHLSCGRDLSVHGADMVVRK
ncbi:MAG: hypothetical protein LBS53_09265 [Synergistaceae bacterium]|nr:hypothetical protein [Synergistaceae bacterium]